MGKKILLSHLKPLARGRSRYVFKHPDNHHHLIKVIRPDIIEERFGKGTKWYKRRRRFGKYLSYLREVQEHLAVHSATNEAPEFLQKVIGFTETDLGLGLIIEGIFSDENKLAPTLGQLLKSQNYQPEHQIALTDCLASILASPVAVSDLNLGNLVYSDRSKKFILIDGLGDPTPFALNGISQFFNRRSKLRRFQRLRARIAQYE